MKKLISLLLALAMVLSLSMVVAAEEYTGPYHDATSITVNFSTVGTTAEWPNEAFEFEIARDSCTDTASDVTAQNMPLPTLDNGGKVSYDAGGTATLGITLPVKAGGETAYTSVGVYTYKITPKKGSTAGIKYHENVITLVVTVLQGDDGFLKVAAVHAETPMDPTNRPVNPENPGDAPGATKTDKITEIYTAGSLKVTKEVTGQLGDTDKEFSVDVTLVAPDDTTVEAPIYYYKDGDTTDKTSVSFSVAETEKTITITLKDTHSWTFENLPKGMTFKVKEADYSADGYDKPKYNNVALAPNVDSFIGSVADGTETEVKITNNKGANVDTGVILDNAPYIVLLAVAVIGLAIVIIKKRQAREY